MDKPSNWQQMLPDLFPNCNTQNLNARQQVALSDESIIIILSGKVCLYAYCPELQEPLLLDYLGSGNWISNTKAPVYLSIQAQSPISFLCLNHQQRDQLISSCNDFAQQYTRHICQQSQHLMQRLCWQKLTACERIAALLHHLNINHEHIELSHSELAMMIGTSRETVSRNLDKLQKQGRIFKDPRQINKIKKTNLLMQRQDEVCA